MLQIDFWSTESLYRKKNASVVKNRKQMDNVDYITVCGLCLFSANISFGARQSASPVV